MSLPACAFMNYCVANSPRTRRYSNLGGKSSNQKPTLLSVLNALLGSDATTSAQKEQINQVVYGFLQNETSISRMYSQLTSIVGYSALRRIVAAVTNRKSVSEDALQEPEREQRRSFEVSCQSTKSLMCKHSTKRSSTGFPTPAYFFKNLTEQEAFFADSPRTPSFFQQISSKNVTPFWIDLPIKSVRSLTYISHRLSRSL